MAKTLAERLEAAKKPAARLADNEALLADLIAEQNRLLTLRDAAAAESIDFALSDSDRDEAAAKAARSERTAQALAAEIASLRANIEARKDSDKAKAVEAEHAAIRAERDALAAEFAKTVPAAVDTLTDLFARVVANADRLKAIGDHNGCAEAKARGVAGFVDPHGPKQFTKMVIPEFGGRERVWPPIERQNMAFFDYGAAIEQARKDRERQETQRREAAEEHARLHGRYRLTSGLMAGEPARIPPKIADRNNLPRGVFHGDPWEGVIAHEIAEELRELPDLTVTRLDPPSKSIAMEKVALPTISENFAC